MSALVLRVTPYVLWLIVVVAVVTLGVVFGMTGSSGVRSPLVVVIVVVVAALLR